jgi:hypothetical protein
MGLTQIAAAGHGDAGSAETPQHYADKIIGRADAAHELLIALVVVKLPAVYNGGALVDGVHSGAHNMHVRQQQAYVAYLRNILNPANPVHKHRGRQNRSHRVLPAAYPNSPRIGFPPRTTICVIATPRALYNRRMAINTSHNSN